MITAITNGILFALAGFLIANVLTMRGEVLDWWPDAVRWTFRIDKDPFKNSNVQLYISKLAYDCGKCVAGQLALWISVFSQVEVGHVAASVTVAVFTAYAIEKHYEG